MGDPPLSTKFCLAGVGSLAKKEITPYSDFEHMIVLENGSKLSSGPCTSNRSKSTVVLDDFRWYSVVFHIILINLGETIVPIIAIDVKDPLSHFFDEITPQGITFDVMIDYASKFPLGPQTDTPNELIKTIDQFKDLLKKNKYDDHDLNAVFSKTCYVYGDEKLYEKFQVDIDIFIAEQDESQLKDQVRKQITQDLGKFATRQVITKRQFNVKKDFYRSTTIIISELGRLHKIKKKSSFEILEELAGKGEFSEFAKQKLNLAVALACEMRLRWYTEKGKQDDILVDEFLKILQDQDLVIMYYQIAYALQCHVSKRLDLKRFHLFSNPRLLNLGVAVKFDDPQITQYILQTIKTTRENYSTLCIEDEAIDTERYRDFDECMQVLADFN